MVLASKTTVFRPQDRDVSGRGDGKHKVQESMSSYYMHVQHIHKVQQLIIV